MYIPHCCFRNTFETFTRYVIIIFSVDGWSKEIFWLLLVVNMNSGTVCVPGRDPSLLAAPALALHGGPGLAPPGGLGESRSKISDCIFSN